MSVKIMCDVCGKTIDGAECVTVFRMWNFPVVAISIEGLSHLASDDDFYLCDRCFERVMDCVEELKL